MTTDIKKSLLLFIPGFCIFLFIFSRFYTAFPFSTEDLFFEEYHLISTIETDTKSCIVVLEGCPSEERIAEAIALADREGLECLYFPGIIAPNIEVVNGYISDYAIGRKLSFHFDMNTRSTAEEARNTRWFCRKNGIETVFVVTSPYHSYRAHWVFEKMVKRADIISAPVRWEESWITRESTSMERQQEVFFLERLKFVLYWVLYSWR